MSREEKRKSPRLPRLYREQPEGRAPPSKQTSRVFQQEGPPPARPARGRQSPFSGSHLTPCRRVPMTARRSDAFFRVALVLFTAAMALGAQPAAARQPAAAQKAESPKPTDQQPAAAQ